MTAGVLLAAAALFVYKNVHFYGDPIRTDPTCVSDGAEYRICSLCGNVQITSELPRGGHTYGEWTTETAPDLISGGTEISVCTRCGTRIERTVPCLAEQLEELLPRLEVFADGSAAGSGSSVPCNYAFSYRGAHTTGTFSLRYLPPDDRAPHDYGISVDLADTDIADADPLSALFTAGNELYAYADHEDPLHIRAEAACHLFCEAASAVSPGFADLLTLPDGISYFGTRVAFYQNNVYLEPRTLVFSPRSFCEHHPAIRAAASCFGGQLQTIFGTDADAMLSGALRSAEAGDFSAFDTDALCMYLTFRDLMRLNGALGDNVLWVYTDAGRWYPLPLITESILGAGGVESGLCDPHAEPIGEDGTPYAAFVQSARTVLAPQLWSCRSTLLNGALSPDAVAAALNTASERTPSELTAQARSAASDTARAAGSSTENIVSWYTARIG